MNDSEKRIADVIVPNRKRAEKQCRIDERPLIHSGYSRIRLHFTDAPYKEDEVSFGGTRTFVYFFARDNVLQTVREAIERKLEIELIDIHLAVNVAQEQYRGIIDEPRANLDGDGISAESFLNDLEAHKARLETERQCRLENFEWVRQALYQAIRDEGVNVIPDDLKFLTRTWIHKSGVVYTLEDGPMEDLECNDQGSPLHANSTPISIDLAIIAKAMQTNLPVVEDGYYAYFPLVEGATTYEPGRQTFSEHILQSIGNGLVGVRSRKRQNCEYLILPKKTLLAILTSFNHYRGKENIFELLRHPLPCDEDAR